MQFKKIHLTLAAMLLPLLLPAARNFWEPAAKNDEWGFRPAPGECSAVTPSPFVWKNQDKAQTYELEYSQDAKFKRTVFRAKNLRWNAYCPSEVMAPGTWYWRVRFQEGNGEFSNWSSVRKFEIAPDASANPMPDSATIAARIPKTHPRIFMRPEELAKFRELAKKELKGQYDALIANCDKLLKNLPPTKEPIKYPADIKRPSKEWIKIWWGNRMYTMKALDAAAELGYGYRLSGNKAYGEAARKLLLECAKWDPAGASSMRYNDEVGMPYLSRFSRTYSFIYDLLTPEERDTCRAVVRTRGKEAFSMLYPRHFYKPYQSHSNRMWHFLSEAGVVFYDEIPEAPEWVDAGMLVYFCVYPVWGDDDGGWHEGIWYWREYLDRFFWWAEVLNNTFDINITAKPFFSKTGYYGLYVAPPGTEDGGFGDLAHLNRKHHALVMQSLATLSGNGYFQWCADRLAPPFKEAPYIEFLRASRPKVEAKSPKDLPTSRCFRGNGLVAMNSNLTDVTQNVQLLFKSSPTGGTTSHGYDANNSFILNVGGKRLLVRSGQRDNYASPFHRNWMWETKSENNITVDGVGQKKMSRDAKGEIADFSTSPKFDFARGEAAGSYEGRLKRFTRRILFCKPEAILIVDTLEAPKPVTFNYHLHSPKPFTVKDQTDICAAVEGAQCKVELLQPKNLKISQTDQFDPPLPAHVKLVQSHLTLDTPEKKTAETFITLIRPGAAAKAAQITTDNQNGWRVIVPLSEEKLTLTVSPEGAINADWGKNGKFIEQK